MTRKIFFISLILYLNDDDGCLLNLLRSSVHGVSQIVTLYILNLYSSVCQFLFFNKTGEKKRKGIHTDQYYRYEVTH